MFDGGEAGLRVGEDEGGGVGFEDVGEDFGPMFGGEAWGFGTLVVVVIVFVVITVGIAIGHTRIHIHIHVCISLVVVVVVVTVTGIDIGRPVPKHADPLIETILPRKLRQPLVFH